MKRIIIHIILLGALLAARPIDSFSQAFVHPGGLVTLDDIDRIQHLAETEKDPVIVSALSKLKNNSYAQHTYTPNAQVRIDRGGDEYSDNYATAMYNVAAAFQNALMWRITGDTRHADCAVRILNAWAKTCKEITGDTNASLASGIYGYEFAQAGELLRGYSGWAAADFKAYQDWMRNLFYPRALYFLEKRHGRTCSSGEGGHYFSNWGLCNLLCLMSIGILCDDVAIYNQGLAFYKDDKCGNFKSTPSNPIKYNGNNEFLGYLVQYLYPDDRGPYGYLGQMQESGRDQGHALMALGLAADVCQVAWNQGDDLFSYMDNRIAAGIEYVALVNSLPSSNMIADSVIYIPYDRTGLVSEGYVAGAVGTGGWGGDRPIWQRIVSHYAIKKGVKMTYSKKMADKVGIDGGGGHYGSNSGGFDHLGFTTLTSYQPETWYPSADRVPVVLGASITYNGVVTADNRISGVAKGTSITLSPSLPEGVTGGSWKWESGETTREITFPVEKSGIYRVSYTASNGVKSVQAFNVAVWGDCTPDAVTPAIKVGSTTYQDTVMTVLPFQSFTLSIGTKMYNRGNAVWNTGSTGFSMTQSAGIRSDSIFWVDHYNEGGYRTRIRFHIKLQYVTPSVSIDGGNAQSTNMVAVEPGQSIELRPVSTSGYDGGTYRWNTGHASKNLMILNIQKSAAYEVHYTLTKNDVTTIDTLSFRVSIAKRNFQLPDGDYYIQRATDGAYLTNTNADATSKVKPSFEAENSEDPQSQTWTIAKDLASNAEGRFKIVSKKDGNYINENCDFGVNPYYSDWNTFTFHCLDGEDLYAIQNGGKSGTTYWVISGNTVTGKGSSSQDGYPFLITPVNPTAKDSIVYEEGENVVSYIAPAYSVSGGASQRGSKILIEPGKNLVLKPVRVSGLEGGSWLWSDNSVGNSLDLGAVEHGGSYSVAHTYPENDTAFVFSLDYQVLLAQDNYQLPDGTYRILRAADKYCLTNDGTLNPVFATESTDLLSQQWVVLLDAATQRHKILSVKDGRFVEEHGRFNNNVYDAEWNTYLFHYSDGGEKHFAIQNAGKSGSTYWAIEGDYINDRNHTTREGYPFLFEQVSSSTGINGVSPSSVKVFPNPVSDYLIVDIEETGASGASFVLYAVDGKVINSFPCQSGSNQIDTSGLSKGVYIGVLTIGDTSQSFKLTK